MESHPPLCPGTEDLCLDGNGDLRGDYGRVWMARYQCCAWQDRAKFYKENASLVWSFWSVKQSMYNKQLNSQFAWVLTGEDIQCERNAAAWREWEVADVQRELDDEHERQKREVSQTGSVNP